MMTFGHPEEKRMLAENIICSVWEKALEMTSNSSHFPEVEKAVETILHSIKGIKGIKITSAERHCFILRIACETHASLLILLDRLDIDCFFWNYLRQSLPTYYRESVVVTGFITLESFMAVRRFLGSERVPKPNLRELVLGLACDSISDAEDLQNFLRSERSQIALDVISQSLSEHLHANISVQLSLDMKSLCGICDGPINNFSEETWNTFMPIEIGFQTHPNEDITISTRTSYSTDTNASSDVSNYPDFESYEQRTLYSSIRKAKSLERVDITNLYQTARTQEERRVVRSKSAADIKQTAFLADYWCSSETTRLSNTFASRVHVSKTTTSLNSSHNSANSYASAASAELSLISKLNLY